MSIFGTIMSKVLGKTPASPVTSTAAPFPFLLRGEASMKVTRRERLVVA
jgi:hypothetical protein